MNDDHTVAQPEPLLSCKEVALLLGLHTNTVKRLSPGTLPYVRVVKRGDRRYRPSDVQAYLEAMNSRATA